MSVTFTQVKRAVADIEPCTAAEVLTHLGLSWTQRTTVRNRINQLVDSGILISDEKRPARFAVNIFGKS